jgi:hypothetical protein
MHGAAMVIVPDLLMLLAVTLVTAASGAGFAAPPPAPMAAPGRLEVFPPARPAPAPGPVAASPAALAPAVVVPVAVPVPAPAADRSASPPLPASEVEVLMTAALRGYEGSMVVIDLKSGEEHAVGPHLHEALMPASTFKLVSSYYLLATGLYRPGDCIDCTPFTLGSRRYRCWNRRGHGDIDVVRALAVSCNGFYFASFTPDVMLGTTELALRLGYTLAEGEPPHLAPDMLIHGDGIKISPLDQARIIAAIAPGAHSLRVKAPVGVLTDPIALGELRRGMEAAVIEGSGRGCRIAGFPVAGKTGSWRGSRWFASYAPAHDPRFVSVAYTRGGSIHGGVDVCRRFYEGWLRSQGMASAPAPRRHRRRRAHY